MWNHTHKILPHAFPHFVKLPNYLPRSTESIIVSLSIHVAQIHTPTQLLTLCLPTVPLNLTLQKAMLISWPMHSLDLGVSLQSSKALHTSSNTVPLLTERKINMLPIYPHTNWNSFRFNHLMVPTLSIANYTNQLWLTHSKRLVLTGLTPFNPSRYLPTS